MIDNKKEETKRILVFLAITFIITYGCCFGIVYPLTNTDDVSGVSNIVAILLISVVMFFPSIGVLLTRLITKEGFHDAWVRPHFKGNIKTYHILCQCLFWCCHRLLPVYFWDRS